MANDDAALPAADAAKKQGTVEAAFGLRAYGGSREAIFRAVLDLFDATPWLRVTRRSYVWWSTDGGPGTPEHLCAALGVTAELSIERLAATGRVIEVRLGATEDQLGGNRHGPDGPGPVVIDLLWAWDSEGHPKPPPPTLPRPMPVGPVPSPPPPPGRSFVHPDVITRASACGPLAEVAPDAQDPVTGEYLSRNLDTVPEPYVENPVPFAAAFKNHTRKTDRVHLHTGEARDLPDLFAAAAEAYGGAPPCAVPMSLTPVHPDVELPVRAVVPEGASDEERLLAWLRAVAALLWTSRLSLRRAVVLPGASDAVVGLIFGTLVEEPLRLGQPTAAHVEFDASWKKWRFSVTVT